MMVSLWYKEWEKEECEKVLCILTLYLYIASFLYKPKGLHIGRGEYPDPY